MYLCAVERVGAGGAGGGAGAGAGAGAGGRRPRAGEGGAPPRTNAPPRGAVVRPRRRGRRRDRWRRGVVLSRDRRRSRRRLRRRGARARAGGRARRPTTGRPIRDRARSRRRRPSARGRRRTRGGGAATSSSARSWGEARGSGATATISRGGWQGGGRARVRRARGWVCGARASVVAKKRGALARNGWTKRQQHSVSGSEEIRFSFATTIIITPRAVVVTIRPFIGASSHRSARGHDDGGGDGERARCRRGPRAGLVPTPARPARGSSPARVADAPPSSRAERVRLVRHPRVRARRDVGSPRRHPGVRPRQPRRARRLPARAGPDGDAAAVERADRNRRAEAPSRRARRRAPAPPPRSGR